MPNKDLQAEWKSSENLSKPQYITDILIAIRKPRKVVREGTKADQYRRVASAARAASLCAGHAQQLGGESPPPNLMEVKG